MTRDLANPSGDKGRKNENHVRDTFLRPIWPTADRVRLKGVNDYGDFINVPWLIEAKWRKKIRGEIWQWILTAVSKVRWNEIHHGLPKDSLPWALQFAQDRRKLPGIDLIIVPAWHYFELVGMVNKSDYGPIEATPRPY